MTWWSPSCDSCIIICLCMVTDPAQPKDEWSLSEGFVAAEGKDLLPPKTVDRTDLVNCYQALLLATLLETGLFDVSESASGLMVINNYDNLEQA